jgi:hypothetical protein
VIVSLLKDPVFSGIFGVLVGGLLGHLFSLGREKRKEFNSATESIRQKAFAHLDEISESKLGNKRIDDNDLLVLKGVLGHQATLEIEKRYSVYNISYWAALKTDKPSNPLDPQPIQTEKIPECKAALKELLKTLEPR